MIDYSSLLMTVVWWSTISSVLAYPLIVVSLSVWRFRRLMTDEATWRTWRHFPNHLLRGTDWRQAAGTFPKLVCASVATMTVLTVFAIGVHVVLISL